MSFEVAVMEYCDGFGLEVKEYHEHGIISSRYFHFDQEDSKEGLVEVFKELGVKSYYEEVC